MGKMNISQKGIDLIKSFEGVRLTSYKALASEKYYTVGYGHYGSDVKKGQKISLAQAEALLKKDLVKFVDGVNDALKVSVNQNQFDAMVSFTYNCGIGALQSSDLLAKVNKKDFAGAGKEFDRWNKSGGKVIQGLVNRRKKERTLFETKVATVAKPKVAVKKPAVKASTSKIKSVGTIKITNVINYTNIYEKPSDKSKDIGNAKKNSTFHISGSVPDWYEVIHNGKRAYIKAKYAKRV